MDNNKLKICYTVIAIFLDIAAVLSIIRIILSKLPIIDASITILYMLAMITILTLAASSIR